MQRDHLYTLVCYRPNGADYRRGCLMGRTNSDHQIASFQSKDDTAGFWGRVKMRDIDASPETCDWEVTLLIDGFGENSVPEEAWETYDGKFDEITALAEASFEHLKRAAAAEARAKKEADDQAAEKKWIADAIKKDADERAEFERLRLKFDQS